MKKELEVLKEEIIFGNNRYNFKTFAIETAGGKTTTAIKAFKDDINAVTPENTYVFVTKLKEEAIKIVTELNKGENTPIAVAYMADDKLIETYEYCTKNMYELSKYRVVIITHSMYANICKPTTEKHKQLKKIISNFRTLVIDEEINPVKNSFYEFNEKAINIGKLLGEYSSSLSDYFNNLIDPLMEHFYNNNYAPKNQLHRIKDFDCNIIEVLENYKFLKKGVADINEYWLEEKRVEGMKEATKESINLALDNILQTWNCINNGLALILPSQKSIFSYAYNFEYLMLENNIWLDASSSFNTMYKNDLFKLVPTERFIDHSNSTVKFIQINTSTSKKNQNKDFKAMIHSYASNYLDEKVLILGKKLELEQLQKNYFKNNGNVSFVNFENMRGKDEYKDCTHCFYIHTYRLPTAYYVFLNDYFNKLTADEEMVVSTKGNIWGFDDKTLKGLMETDMVSSMYQGLKRIQRNQSPKALYHIFCNEPKIVAGAVKQMKGLYCKDLIERVDKPMTDKEKIRKWINEEWDHKRILCKEVRNILDIGSINWTKIWNDKEFVAEMKSKRIKVGLTKKSKKDKYLMKY